MFLKILIYCRRAQFRGVSFKNSGDVKFGLSKPISEYHLVKKGTYYMCLCTNFDHFFKSINLKIQKMSTSNYLQSEFFNSQFPGLIGT